MLSPQKKCSFKPSKINKISEISSYLELDKQGYKCKNRNHKMVAQSNIFNYRCRINNNVKLAIFNCAKEIMSKSLISRLYNVSDNTVQNVFNTMFYNDKVIYKEHNNLSPLYGYDFKDIQKIF